MKIGMYGRAMLMNRNVKLPNIARVASFLLTYFSENSVLKGFIPVLSKSIEAPMKVKQDRPNQYTNIDIPSKATYL